MQVLVALVRGTDRVISRDDLIRDCWSGRIVGDDAINGAVAKVRRLANLTAEASFKIETIPRVGYRLRIAEVAEAAPMNEAVLQGRPAFQRRVLTIGAGLTILAACLFLIGRWWIRSPQPLWSVERAEVSIAGPLIQRWPAISPDGKMIAYSAGPDITSRKLYLKPIAGGEPLRLTDDAYDDTSPTWSPDGSQIAYVARKQGEPCRLMVTAVPAGPAHQLGSCLSSTETAFAWARSGRELFFLDRLYSKSRQRVLRFDLASGSRESLTPLDGDYDEGEFSLSPDGHWISFVRADTGGHGHLLLRDLRTGEERILLDNADANTAWAQDSQTIFVDSDDQGDFALWAYPVDTGTPVRILSSPERMLRLSSGPNGLLAVELAKLYATLAQRQTGDNQPKQLLSPGRVTDFAFKIGSTGTIAIVSEREGALGLWLLQKGASAAHKLIDLPLASARFYEPRWSPDGSKIALASTAPGTAGIRIITALGADVAYIPFAGITVDDPVWTEQGDAVIFPGYKENGWQLWRAELSKPSLLQPLPQKGWVAIQAKGGALYGTHDNEPGVWRIDGTPRQITTISYGELWRHCWAVTDDSIDYVVGLPSVSRQIFTQPLAGGPSRVLINVPDYLLEGDMAIDPESGAILYSALQSQENDIEILHLARH